MRRGEKTANDVWGNNASVLVGDFLFSRAFQLMVETRNLEVLASLSNAAARITEGEVLQLTSAYSLDLSVETYLEIISSKTAALFASACEVGGMIAGMDPMLQNDLYEFGHSLGMIVTITPEKASAQSQTSSKEEDVIMNIKTSESPPRSIGAGARNRAYVGRTFNVGTRVQRPFNDAVGGSLGLLWEAGHIRRENVTYNTHLLGVPGELKIDGSNDLLNPTHGGRADFKVTPYIGKMSTSNGMTITQANLTGYLPFMSNELGESDGVLAGFVKGGSIFIKSLDFVPPNKRFYAGGGGSVRGYGYQLLGLLDTQNIPLGGRSLAEGGSVSVNKMPDFRGRNMLWGTGVGARYYSAVGPIRLDIAIPLKRRKDPISGKAIDAAYQFYISVGQAF
eukprot:gene13504-13619_t